MERTERVLVAGSIACLLALSALAGVASCAVPGEMPPVSSPRHESPGAFAERASGPREDASGFRGIASFRNAVELLILVAACGLVVAFYSASTGGQGGKRVLMRIRRR